MSFFPQNRALSRSSLVPREEGGADVLVFLILRSPTSLYSF